MKTQKGKIAALILGAIIWGSYYVASQQVVAGMSVFTAGIGIRFLTFVFLSIIMWRKGELPLLLKTKGVFKRLVLIGVFGFLLDLTAFIGLSVSTAATGVALLKCDVLMVNIMSMIIYKDKFTWKAWGFTFVMLFGVFLVMGIDFSTFEIANPGNIFFILSAFFVSCNAFVIKSAQTDKNNPICDNVVAYYNNFVTMILFTITSLIMGTIGQLQNVFTDPGTGIALLCAGLGQTLVYVSYYYNLRRNPVWLVKVFLLLMPVVSAIVSFVLFGTTMVTMQYVGIAVVIAGAFGILFEQRKK